MRISLNWLSEFVDFSMTTEELDHVLTMLGVEVEEIIDYKKIYQNFVTAKVLEKEKHPNADKLSLCKVDTGTEIKTVVCGAANVAKGQSVVLGLIGAVVPNGGFKLEKRAVRGIESEGMICSQVELDLGTDSSGIMVLPEDIKPGIALAEYLGMNDTVLDISVTPNKADCLSHLGIARELSAYNSNPLKKAEINLIEGSEPVEKSIEVIIEDAVKCPRYTARVIKNVKIQESPDWIKNRLILLGLRPINIAVDVTNLVLMEVGQPLHAFDLNKIASNKIIVKTAKAGDKFTSLDSKERLLDETMLMICDAEKAIAIGGVMGGENSEINNDTTDILIESAFFNSSSVRKTSKKLSLQSDSSYRFERGVDIDNITWALDRAAQLIAEYTGGTIQKGRIDNYPIPKIKELVKLRYAKANKIIGINLSGNEIKNLLSRLHFTIISDDSESVTVEVPSYRMDVSIEVDLVEEVARLYNYDNIEADFTSHINFEALRTDKKLSMPPLRGSISSFLISRGLHEILTQNIIDPVSAKLFSENPVAIANPLGEELSIMRPSLIPSMLITISRNIRVGNSSIQLFEVGKSFHNVTESDETFIAGIKENEELIIALTGKSNPVNWGVQQRNFDFYDIKGIVEILLSHFRFDSLKFKEFENDNIFSKNSAGIVYKADLIGKLGEVSKSVLKQYEIENDVLIAVIDLTKLYNIKQREAKYSHVAPYPGSSRDLAFIVDKSVNVADILKEIKANGGNLLTELDVFDVYAGKNIGEGKKSLAFSLYFSSPERTLVEDDIDKPMKNIIPAIEKKFSAVLRKS
jgi:phenylalanyl-tRNA synthetase beta chain